MDIDRLKRLSGLSEYDGDESTGRFAEAIKHLVMADEVMQGAFGDMETPESYALYTTLQNFIEELEQY